MELLSLSVNIMDNYHWSLILSIFVCYIRNYSKLSLMYFDLRIPSIIAVSSLSRYDGLTLILSIYKFEFSNNAIISKKQKPFSIQLSAKLRHNSLFIPLFFQHVPDILTKEKDCLFDYIHLLLLFFFKVQINTHQVRILLHVAVQSFHCTVRGSWILNLQVNWKLRKAHQFLVLQPLQLWRKVATRERFLGYLSVLLEKSTYWTLIQMILLMMKTKLRILRRLAHARKGSSIPLTML